MIYACYRTGYRGRHTVHGFRGLASTWANEAEDYRVDWIEMALAPARLLAKYDVALSTGSNLDRSQARTAAALVECIGELLGCILPDECTNFFHIADYQR